MSGGPPALVVTYHRVASVERDPLEQCVDPDRFAAQIDRLSAVAEIVPLTALTEPARSPRIAITFDDGYADNSAVAAPILRAAGAPATFFVPSRILDDPTEYWWDRLEHILLDPPWHGDRVDVAPSGRRLRVDLRSEAGRLRALKVLNRRLRPLPLSAIDPIVAQVAEQLGAAGTGCSAHALMSQADVAALGADPLFEVGSHGTAHAMLSALTAAEQQVELELSRDLLSNATGLPVKSFAYPYGTPTSFDADTIASLERCGYRLACTNTPGPFEPQRDPYRLPRFMVYDWTAAELGERVSRWFASL